MDIFAKNIESLKISNYNLASKILTFLNQSKLSFRVDENLNIYDSRKRYLYENKEQINQFASSILDGSKNYPFIFIYGIANGELIKNLSFKFKHIFVFESEIELLILALNIIDISEELKNYKIILLDPNALDFEIQVAMFFDHQDILEYLSLYKLFASSLYYKDFFSNEILKVNEICIKTADVAIRNADRTCYLPLLTYKQFLCNIPTMLENIPFQRLLNQRKNTFDTAIVVSAGPSLAKQLPLLKKYQNKAFIFCADGALSILLKEDIKPDYVTNLDFSDWAINFFKNIPNLNDALIMLECATHPNVVQFLKDKNVSLVLRNKNLYMRYNLNDFGYIDTGTHVSHFSYTLALALGFKNIIMIGQDLAYDEKGNSHSNGYYYTEKSKEEYFSDTLEVEAYGGNKQIKTHIFWNDYRIKLEYLFACNQEVNFYNATEGGARINFTKEISFKNACENLLHKEKPKFENLKPLTKNRSSKLIAKFFEKLKQDKQTCENLLNDAKALKEALDNILSKDIILPLEFLQNVHKNISSFNEILANNEFVQDEALRGNFAYRGYLISCAIRDTNDEREYLFAYIKAYKEWLKEFLEKLNTKYESILEALNTK
ncbi:motility associated factor glycosyltransferase family protein [Campylobacter novaezeelandiae]|uniref:motility associated factor glycosyltransferase family protein n=2 Tax=Campylobacter novaezeelandiae TaxID=2267891 RepID=UPI001905A8C5|nr:motility associated factor glycosyltransferase family protein [Campylobacter novaezeelandiae]MBK1964009.1 motility associated factor glycosyltransferase family protein [Campylobacter novaezeelandiae]